MSDGYAPGQSGLGTTTLLWAQHQNTNIPSRSPGVNFINIYACIFRTKFWRQSRNVTRKAAKKDVRTKKSMRKNDDEIDGSSTILTS